MRRKRKSDPENEESSLLEIWHDNYKEKTAHLSSWERQCLELLRQPIEQAARRILAYENFKSILNVEEVIEAFAYEELVFFAPKVVEMCTKIAEEVKHFLDDL